MKNSSRILCGVLAVILVLISSGFTSFAASITITSQPTDITVEPNATATFKVVAQGTGLTYQWQYSVDGKNWISYSSAASKQPTYSCPVPASYDGRKYRCIITDANKNSVTSSVVTLSVKENKAINITSQPVNVFVEPNSIATFSVAAEGSELTYQWQYTTNGSVWNSYSSAASKQPTYSCSVPASYNGRKYRCLIKDNKGNTATTNVVTLTVTDYVPLYIVNQPTDIYAEPDTTATFSIGVEGIGLTYQWQYSTNNGTTWNSYSSAASKQATYGSPVPESYNGRLYRCVVKDVKGNSVTSEVVTLYVRNNIGLAILKQPTNVFVEPNMTAVFTVEAEGVGLTYQWQYSTDGTNWNSYTSAASKQATYSCPVPASYNGRKYRCIVTDARGNNVASEPITLVVRENISLVIRTQPTNVFAEPNGVATFSVDAEGVGLTYQWEYSTNGTTWSSYSSAASRQATYSCPVPASYNGRKHRCIVKDAKGNSITTNVVTLTVMDDIALVITTQPTNVFAEPNETATFSVEAEGVGLTYQWQYSNNGVTWNSYSSAASRQATYSCPVPASYNGRKHRCIINDAKGNSITTDVVTLTVMEYTPLTIKTQPTNVFVNPNETATFTVVAEGVGLTYQWEYSTNGSTWNSYSSVASRQATYSCPVPSNYDGRKHRCVIKDAKGNTEISDVVILNVGYHVAITTNPTASITFTKSTDTKTLTVAATGDDLKYQWQVKKSGSSSYVNCTNGTNYANATTATLTIKSQAASNNGDKYRCVVTDKYNETANSTESTVTCQFVIDAQWAAGNVTTIEKGKEVTVTVKQPASGITVKYYVNGTLTTSNVTNGVKFTASTVGKCTVKAVFSGTGYVTKEITHEITVTEPANVSLTMSTASDASAQKVEIELNKTGYYTAYIYAYVDGKKVAELKGDTFYILPAGNNETEIIGTAHTYGKKLTYYVKVTGSDKATLQYELIAAGTQQAIDYAADGLDESEEITDEAIESVEEIAEEVVEEITEETTEETEDEVVESEVDEVVEEVVEEAVEEAVEEVVTEIVVDEVA